MSEQKFGGVWTIKKLDAVENYLKAYTIALKKQKFHLIYIDAFAGSGTFSMNELSEEPSQIDLFENNEIKNNNKIFDGSAIRALKYPFNKFKFFETNKEYCNNLEQKIKENYWNIDYSIINEDCNSLLMKINSYNWLKNNYRGVIFIDPYDMGFSWECLEEIGKTQIFDVWYLFPFGAMNRNVYRKSSDIPKTNKIKVTQILGTDDWINKLYNQSFQLNILGEDETEKVTVQEVKQYVIKRFKTIFPTVSEEAVLLRNKNNAPMFLLCFMGSNPNPKAKKTALDIADYILKNMERV